MSTTSSEVLEYKVKSEGVALANERMAAMPQLAATMEQVVARLTAVMEASSRQQVLAVEAAEAAKQRAQHETDRRFALSMRKQVEDERQAAQQKLHAVERELMTEAQLVRAHENERRRIIISNTEITEAKRAELLRLSAMKTRNELLAANSSKGLAGLGGLAGMAAGGAALALGHDLLSVTREFDRLNASLVTVTGSSKNAAEAFTALQDFAATTPYQLQEVVGAFVQLRNLGLDATERSLTAYGDMAAAFGDTFDHMLLAVGDAVMGINRPLKQFGVMAEDAGKKAGTIRYTFRGVTTEVEQNAQAIQKYLIELAENNFAGAMANRMKTLDGALSNLEDNWHKLELAITQSGIEGALTGIVNKTNDWLSKLAEITKQYGPGMFGAAADAAKNAAVGAVPGGQAVGLFASTVGYFTPEQKLISTDEQESKDRLARYRSDVGKLEQEKNREAFVELVKHLKTKREKIEEEYEKQKEIVVKAATGNIRLEADQLARAQKVRDDAIAALDQKDERKTAAAEAKARRDRARFEKVEGEVDPLLKLQKEFNERQAYIDKYTRHSAARHRELSADNQATYDKEVDKLLENQNQELENLEASLKNEEDAIDESYRKRRRIIDQYAEDSEARDRLQAIVRNDYARQIQALRESQIQQREALTEELTTEEERIRRSFAKRRRDVAGAPLGFSSPFEGGDEKARALQAIDRREAFALQEASARKAARRADTLADPNNQLDAVQREMAQRLQALEEAYHQELLSAEELEQAKLAVRQEYARKSADVELSYALASADQTSALFGNLATAAKNFGGESSKAYHTMFAAQKAAAVASGTLNMYKSISEASAASPWMAKIPLMIQAAAQGAALIAQISSVNYSGAYDLGGDISAGKVGLVGEYGPEFVRGPASVTSRADTARMLQDMRSQAGSAASDPRIDLNVGIDLNESFNRYLSSTQGVRTVNVHLAKNRQVVRAAGGR